MDGKKKKDWQCFACKTSNEPNLTECQKKGCGKSKPSWLKFTRKATENYENKSKILSKEGQNLFEELGRYFEKLIEVIPGGLILVFPSMNLMEKCRYAWFEGSQYGAIIEKVKKIFIQPRKKHEYKQVVQQYKQHVDQHGHGMLFSVSQTDFLDSYEIKDNLSRAIFIIGKPGMDSSDGYVIEKMDYLEKLKSNGKGTMDKWHWFNDYSIREINKTIGKVIRHKYDYGAVYLIDDVFNSAKWVVERVSEWAKENIKKETSLEQLAEDTQKFFSQEFQKPKDYEFLKHKNDYSLYHSDKPIKQEKTQYEKDLEKIAQQYYNVVDTKDENINEDEDEDDFM